MASIEKFSASAVGPELRHNERTIGCSSNKDIDPTRSHLNYSLLPGRAISSYDYFKKRKKELYCYNRKDVKVMAGWIVTAPKNLPVSEHREFFELTHDFLQERYGAENCVQSIVHMDEKGQPHLHYCFIPATPDLKHGGFKICANDVINREELRNFHPALKHYLREWGIDADVNSGITAAQGGNRTVRELKQEHSYEAQHERRW